MKIKQLKWKKRWADDKSSFWYDTDTKPPFEYCVEPNLTDSKWTAWITDAEKTDKKLGVFLSSDIAKKVCQAEFEKRITKLYMEKK